MKTAQRRFLSVSLSIFFILSLISVTVTPAAAAGKGVDIYLNGDAINIPPSFGSPFYDKNGRLQIPMRYIIQSCGYDVAWNNASRSATVPTKSGDVIITVGSNLISAPSGKVAMDTSAEVVDGRTYIPLRFALEALDFHVKWTAGSTADRIDITGEIGAASKRVPMTAADVSDLASPATFYIEVSGDNNVPFASGSGFFIDPCGVGVTNYHVIQGATHAKITTVDGKTYEMGMVLYHDKDRDLVVFDALPTDPTVKTINVPYLNTAATSSIRNGDVVYAIGSPLGLQNSITDGIVSNKDRTLPGDTMPYIQTSAPISNGNSGGPLINQYGEVVGINTASLADGQNLNLAIPVSDLAAVNYNDTSTWVFLFEVFDSENSILPPTNVRVVRSNNNAVFIQWDPVAGAEYYHFYYQEAGEDAFYYDGENGPQAFQWLNDASIEYSDLTPGTTYNVIVTSVKGGVESADSKVLNFIFKPNLGAPTNTQVTPSQGLKHYSDAWWLVDYGATFGCTPSYHVATSEYIEYHYKYNADVKPSDYYTLMQGLGFFYNSEMTKSLGENYNDPLYWENPKSGASFVGDIDYSTGDFVIVTILP